MLVGGREGTKVWAVGRGPEYGSGGGKGWALGKGS